METYYIRLEKNSSYWIGTIETTVDDTSKLVCQWGKEGGKESNSYKEFESNKRFTHQERAVTAMFQKARVKVRAGYRIVKYNVPSERLDTLKELFAIGSTKNVQKLTFVSGNEIDSVEPLLPVIASIKLNGVSCRVENGKLMSRSNKEFTSLTCLKERIQPIITELEGVQFELYNQNLSLEEIVEDIAAGGDKVEPWMFDIMVDQPAIMRTDMLFNLYQKHDILKMPQMIMLFNTDQVKSFYQEVICNSGEGIVVHCVDAGYHFGKRPATSVKIKPIITCEFEIVDAVADSTGKGDQVISYIVDTPGGSVKVTQLGDVPTRNQLWQEYQAGTFDPIGKQLTVSFREWTKYNKPRHITKARIRDEKLEGPANEK